MFTDPVYGLNNIDNYQRWNVLHPTASTNQTQVNQKLAFQAELRTYFGLNSAQVKEITNNWYGLYAQQRVAVWNSLPSPSTYQNTFGFMYWQWSMGQMT